MPDITFLTEKVPPINQWDFLWALMLFPKEEEKQKALCAYYEYKRRIDVGLFEPSKEKSLIKIIDIAFSTEPMTDEIIDKGLMRGTLAGLQLYISLLLDSKNEPTGLKRSRSIIEENKDKLFTAPSSVTASIKSLERIWRNYYSVSHLWSALEYFDENDLDLFNNIDDFIKTSNSMSNLAASCFPDNKNSILDLNKLWLPSNYHNEYTEIIFKDFPEFIKTSSINYSDYKKHLRKA